MTHPVPLFPTEDKLRKMLPVFKQLTRYFPRAFREMTKVSVVNNVRYNPGRDANDINWARGKSPHQMDSALKHMMEHVDGKVFDEVDPKVAEATGITRIYILAQAMWRIGAELELLIEKTELAELGPATGVRDPKQPIPADKVVLKCQCGAREYAFDDGDIPPSVIGLDGMQHTIMGCERV
jgi:hypothetical protein